MNLPISIRGARQHNLQNLNLDLPSGKLIAFSGPSGSGKSSLAFDTLFAESRRRFLDCLSARARQGIEQPDKPDVDSITGLPPLFPWSSPPGTSIPGPCWEASRKSWITCASCTRRPGAPTTRRRERNWSGKPRTRLRTPWPPSPNKRAWY